MLIAIIHVNHPCVVKTFHKMCFHELRTDKKEKHVASSLRAVRIRNRHPAKVSHSSESALVLRYIVGVHGTASTVKQNDLLPDLADVRDIRLQHKDRLLAMPCCAHRHADLLR